MREISQHGAHEKVAFANALRGIASLFVVLVHYVVMFSIIKGAIQGFSPILGAVYPHWLVHAVTFFMPVDLGAIGIALFFLISGFVIPNSIASLPDSWRGRLGFAIARILRIYPTYLVGFAITMSALCFAATHTHKLAFMPYWKITEENVLYHMTLFRDWFNTPMFDGVVWTLEIEIKFYLFALLFWRGIARGRGYVFVVIAIASLLTIPYRPTEMIGLTEPANYLFAVRFVLFMSIGTAFNYHLRGLISRRRLLEYATSMVAVFAFSSDAVGVAGQMTISCFVALLIFSGLYRFRRQWTGGRVVCFLSDISYPLYVVHAAFGYVGMRWMIEQGVHPLMALPAQVVITLALAWVMHSTVEVWTHRFGKWLSRIVAGKRPTILPWATRLDNPVDGHRGAGAGEAALRETINGR